MKEQQRPPSVEVEPQPPASRLAGDRWRCAWIVRNLSTGPLQIVAAWLPHGRFRAERVDYAPSIVVLEGGSKRFEFEVACQEPPGTIVENCFVILTVDSGGHDWRIFARLTVAFGADGAPDPLTELVTVNPVGFAS